MIPVFLLKAGKSLFANPEFSKDVVTAIFNVPARVVAAKRKLAQKKQIVKRSTYLIIWRKTPEKQDCIDVNIISKMSKQKRECICFALILSNSISFLETYVSDYDIKFISLLRK